MVAMHALQHAEMILQISRVYHHAAIKTLTVLSLNARRKTKQDDEQELLCHFQYYGLIRYFSSAPILHLFRGGQSRNRICHHPDKESVCG